MQRLQKSTIQGAKMKRRVSERPGAEQLVATHL